MRGLCQNKEFQAVWHAACDAGADWRKAQRVKVAESHAVDGVDKPVYQAGALVGHIREFDHRLLQFLLESDDPAKYRAQPPAGSQSGAVVNVQFTLGPGGLGVQPIRQPIPVSVVREDTPDA
jgi:hypothetical protein